MREILFRGKSVNDGNWVQGSLVITTIEPADDTPIKHYHIEDMTIGVFPDAYQSGLSETVDPNTVGQFTGLIVKGKRWFEHDIVSVRYEGEETYRFVIAFGVCGGVQNVKHTVGYMGFHFIPANEETRRCIDMGARNDPLYWLTAYDCETIGNIHDNPELLEATT